MAQWVGMRAVTVRSWVRSQAGATYQWKVSVLRSGTGSAKGAFNLG